MQEPWTMLLLIFLDSDKMPFTLHTWLRPVRTEHTQFSTDLEISNVVSLDIYIKWSTASKAREKSTNNAHIDYQLTFHWHDKWSEPMQHAVVRPLGLSAYWSYNLLATVGWIQDFAIILSAILLRIGVRDIGLNSDGCSGFMILGTGVTTTHNRCLGSWPTEKDRLKIWATIEANSTEQSLNNHAGSLTHPAAVHSTLRNKISIS